MKKIKHFPELRQCYHYDCGANALQSVLTYYGFDIREENIIKVAQTTKQKGTSPSGLLKAANHFGLNCLIQQMTIEDLKHNINDQIPIIILIQAWENPNVKSLKSYWGSGHYVIPVGYDKTRIYFEDPSCTTRSYLTFLELEERWHDCEMKDDKRKEYYNYGIKFTRKDGKKAQEPKPVHLGSWTK